MFSSPSRNSPESASALPIEISYGVRQPKLFEFFALLEPQPFVLG